MNLLSIQFLEITLGFRENNPNISQLVGYHGEDAARKHKLGWDSLLPNWVTSSKSPNCAKASVFSSVTQD